MGGYCPNCEGDCYRIYDPIRNVLYSTRDVLCKECTSPKKTRKASSNSIGLPNLNATSIENAEGAEERGNDMLNRFYGTMKRELVLLTIQSRLPTMTWKA